MNTVAQVKTRAVWTLEEVEILRCALYEHGVGANKAIAALLPTKTVAQCANKIRVLLPTLNPRPRQSKTTAGTDSGSWTQGELTRLLDGANRERTLDVSILTGYVPTRSDTQVARLLQRLTEAGTLVAGDDGDYWFSVDPLKRTRRQ